ncbi:hypothetical protein PPERSA_04438 [Pseudocohnilembus persalinus]|uniref:Uncharacterized protein n=1 Tax=Pseudocohnilembus persalinus TaxID=266149 RepID=A0A0V0QQR7_PSEPJ|nr:hypothetical protein PPERSA_04438 [Pseudocohnilembus persalinus]|eukprot:KRX04623.1 hypothetical protein PPERSA_04438 [Pseudocohnilembus persalinus]
MDHTRRSKKRTLNQFQNQHSVNPDYTLGYEHFSKKLKDPQFYQKALNHQKQQQLFPTVNKLKQSYKDTDCCYDTQNGVYYEKIDKLNNQQNNENNFYFGNDFGQFKNQNNNNSNFDNYGYQQREERDFEQNQSQNELGFIYNCNYDKQFQNFNDGNGMEFEPSIQEKIFEDDNIYNYNNNINSSISNKRYNNNNNRTKEQVDKMNYLIGLKNQNYSQSKSFRNIPNQMNNIPQNKRDIILKQQHDYFSQINQ